MINLEGPFLRYRAFIMQDRQDYMSNGNLDSRFYTRYLSVTALYSKALM
jgi:hypothetical protein